MDQSTQPSSSGPPTSPTQPQTVSTIATPITTATPPQQVKSPPSDKLGPLITGLIVVAVILFVALIVIITIRFLPKSKTTESEIIPIATGSGIPVRTAAEQKAEAILRERGTWASYENKTHEYSFVYPNGWKLIDESLPEGTVFRFELRQGEVITGTVLDRPTTKVVGSTQREFALSPNKTLLIVYAQCLGPSCGEGSLDIPSFTSFLDTVKILEGISPEPTIITLPAEWIKRDFPTASLGLYAPKEWKSGIESLPDTSSEIISLWRGSTQDTSTMRLDIKNRQDNVDGSEYPRTYRINDKLVAAKIDPPKKNESSLETFQTKYLFDYANKTYTFTCVHNWIDADYKVCEAVLKSIEITE